mmetsp:Transcript_125911/g.403090  ORF Transcript_125911/g.403090 Transcript_125911/m.403090 type:complete len:1070 (-) Transcript_125911:50-3259(-)
MQFLPGELSSPWPEVQAPIHVTPQSVHNLETFSGMGRRRQDLSMADISQQTYPMSAELRHATSQDYASGQHAANVDRSHLEPRRVGGALSQPTEVQGFQGPPMFSNDAWLLGQHVAAQAREIQGLEGAAAAADPQRQLAAASSPPQAANAQHFAHMAQLLQSVASAQGGIGMGGEGSLFQRTLAEFALRSAAASSAVAASEASAVAEHEAAAAAAAGSSGLAGGAAAPAMLGFGFPASVDLQTSALDWGAWAQQVAAVPTTTLAANDLTADAASSVDSFSNGQRVEELNNYIRQQASEYIEAQTEWSRQIAEVRSECTRELDKVKRDKLEVERQAREELLRLRQRLREAGLSAAGAGAGLGGAGDEGALGADGLSGSAVDGLGRPVTHWAAGVGMDEFKDVHRKWTSAEDRIKELEQYINDQSAKQNAGIEARTRERDDEVRGLRQALLHGSLEQRQLRDDLEVLRAQYQQKVSLWEQGTSHLLAATEQFLGSQSGLRQCDREELENSRFGRTAKKLSLTLPTQGEGSNVGSLRRMLKDMLKNDKERTSKTLAKGSAGCLEGSGSERADEAPKGDDAKAGEGSQAAGEGECPTPAPFAANGRASSALSDSNPSSRDTSPSRGTLRVIDRHKCCASGAATTPPLPDAKVGHFVTQISNDLRHLLAMSQQKGRVSAPSPNTQCPSQESSPRSVGSAPSSGSIAVASPGEAERRRVQQCIDSIPPARQGIAQNIIAVEKLLRGLDRELRRECTDLFGCAELQEVAAAGSDEEASALAREARTLVPMTEELQLVSLSGLRGAQRHLAAVLAEFVQLPQKLKTVFDLTKALTSEINGLVPASMLQQVEAQAAAARRSEQRQLHHVEVLQRRLQALNVNGHSSAQVAGVGTGGMPLTPPLEMDEGEAAAGDATQSNFVAGGGGGGRGVGDAEGSSCPAGGAEELDPNASQEEQLEAARSELRRLSRELAGRDDRLRNLEREIVDLQISRYGERAQCVAMLQQQVQQKQQQLQQQHHQQPDGSLGSKPPGMSPWWPWGPMGSGGLPDFVKDAQAWGINSEGQAGELGEWKASTCVA